MSDIQVAVRKSGRIVERLSRPVRQTAFGPAVTYRKKLWLLSDDTIDLDQPPLPDEAKRTTGIPVVAEAGEDPGQAAVLALSCDARALVEAGPGTGKTHVACQRIAALIKEGVNPHRIWVVSFTRTAVVEFRNRIAASLEDPAEAASVRIATLDSHAWSLQSGFSADAKLTGSYDDSILGTLRQLRENTDTADYLLRLQHLIIDEGQDIVGPRAELTLALVDGVDPTCGVTVFADEAQAIYTFTEEAEGTETSRLSLLDSLRERGFQELGLARVHRTDCPKLRSIFTEVRRRVLNRRGSAAVKSEAIRQDIIRLAHENAGNARDLKLDSVPSETLILLRRRVDVFERSSWNSEIPHRLRMSGFPSRIRPWISAILWDFTEGRLSRSEFERRWSDRAAGCAGSGAPSIDVAWQLLVEAAGESTTQVDITRLRELLGRASPPMLFCSPEYGDCGPILGTIHASKGREADHVRLYLPPLDEEKSNLDEEARVVFVGATRARRHLAVGESSNRPSKPLQSGRAWRFARDKVRIEVGRPEDINASGLVGHSAFATAAEAADAQSAWLAQSVRMGLRAVREADLDWNYALLDAQGERLAVLSQAFDDDLRELGRRIQKWRKPSVLPHLRSLGLRSLVLRPNDPLSETLHDPWRSSGFLFAPLLTGFPSGTFG